MRLGFLVNDIDTERVGHTTLKLAMTAANRGHEVWLFNAGDLTYDLDERVRAPGRAAAPGRHRNTAGYLRALKGARGRVERVTLDDLDILMLRNDAASAGPAQPWLKTVGIIFGNLLVRSGVIVLNDPTALAGALDKMYIQLMPADVRPKTLISCDPEEIRAFVEAQGGVAVIKGFQGSSAQAVFLVTRENRANLNQMIEAIARYGYVIAQEYLPGAEGGSVRLFLVNGEPLRHRGRVAAFQWVRTEEGMRADIHAPGSSRPVSLTEAHLHIAEAVRPRLVQDGMFLAGLEIIDDRLVDIDVFSPDGLVTAQSFGRANFSEAVILAVERKVDYMTYYRRRFDNVEMATL